MAQTPSKGGLIPNNTREAGETHAYDHDQVVQILEILPLLAKSLVATAAFAGLRKGELRGLEWNDCTSNKLTIKRSIWGSVISPPKTRAGTRSGGGSPQPCMARRTRWYNAFCVMQDRM